MRAGSGPGAGEGEDTGSEREGREGQDAEPGSFDSKRGSDDDSIMSHLTYKLTKLNYQVNRNTQDWMAQLLLENGLPEEEIKANKKFTKIYLIG